MTSEDQQKGKDSAERGSEEVGFLDYVAIVIALGQTVILPFLLVSAVLLILLVLSLILL